MKLNGSIVKKKHTLLGEVVLPKETTTSFLFSGGASDYANAPTSVAPRRVVNTLRRYHWTSHGLAIWRVLVRHARTRSPVLGGRRMRHALCLHGCTAALHARTQPQTPSGQSAAERRAPPCDASTRHPGFGFPGPARQPATPHRRLGMDEDDDAFSGG
jgi:hypothetical protein